MIKLSQLAFVLIVSLSAAHAQQPNTQPTDRLKLDLSRAEVQVIVNGLLEMPYKTAAPVLNELKHQIDAQEKKESPK